MSKKDIIVASLCLVMVFAVLLPIIVFAQSQGRDNQSVITISFQTAVETRAQENITLHVESDTATRARENTTPHVESNTETRMQANATPHVESDINLNIRSSNAQPTVEPPIFEFSDTVPEIAIMSFLESELRTARQENLM
ncbi:MAG: hypothetical protein FWD01_01215, partial [Defluviitaleaceae bacterium]|nr:hypothetical protein [Defluviitaleaceae bacterium]